MLGAWALIVLIPLGAAAADSPRTEWVVLKSGAVYQGELVEKVPGDHLTLKLATGEIKNFGWNELDDTPIEPRYLPWPEPDRSPRRLAGRHLSVGLGWGWDSPLSFPGEVLVEYEPTAWFGVQLEGRYGNSLGPSLSEMVHFGLPVFDAGRFGIGAGMQQFFSVRSPPAAPAHFANFELFSDSLFGPNLMLRGITGFGLPVAAGLASPGVGFYIKADLVWRFAL
jgi:hypothetical protein